MLNTILKYKKQHRWMVSIIIDDFHLILLSARGQAAHQMKMSEWKPTSYKLRELVYFMQENT